MKEAHCTNTAREAYNNPRHCTNTARERYSTQVLGEWYSCYTLHKHCTGGTLATECTCTILRGQHTISTAEARCTLTHSIAQTLHRRYTIRCTMVATARTLCTLMLHYAHYTCTIVNERHKNVVYASKTLQTTAHHSFYTGATFGRKVQTSTIHTGQT